MRLVDRGKTMNAPKSYWKYLLFSLVPAIAMLFALEMISRAISYQRHGKYSLSLHSNIVAVKNL